MLKIVGHLKNNYPLNIKPYYANAQKSIDISYHVVVNNNVTIALGFGLQGCIPVFLEEVCDQYYNGYCNNILWPIFHYLGTPPEYRNDATITYHSQYDAYKKANRIFFDVVKEHYEEGDVVWCHDYHVMLLPQYLKEYNSKMKVGWFLHTPFPSSEMYKTLPSRSDLLRSVLTADLVG